MTPTVPRQAEWTALGVVALGFALRAHGFSEPWLNPDEGIYFQLATARSWQHLVDGIASNAHPPLQYLLLRAVALFSHDFGVLRGCADDAECDDGSLHHGPAYEVALAEEIFQHLKGALEGAGSEYDQSHAGELKHHSDA